MESYLFTYDVGKGEETEVIEGQDDWACIRTFAAKHPFGKLIRIERHFETASVWRELEVRGMDPAP
ncbi:MAG: hypothetical protein ACE5HU_06295 [Acidobacteriota bacterium]